MGGGAPSIPQRSLSNELGSILNYLPKFTQKEFNLTSQFAPKFSAQDIGLSKEFAPQYAGLGYDITKQFAPQYLGLNLEQMQKNIAGQPLLAELNKEAGTELGKAGHLTDQEAYQQTQGTLGTFAGRNNVFNQAAAQSFLDRDALVRQRANEARGFASGVQNLNLGQLGGIGGVAQMPNLAAYGAPGASYQPMQAGLGTSGAVANPLLNYGSDVFSSNQNAAATQNIAASNKSGGMMGAGIGALGSIAGAAGIAL